MKIRTKSLFFLVLLLCFNLSNSLAQTEEQTKIPQETQEQNEATKVYLGTEVDEQAHFPGNDADLMRFLQRSITYPPNAKAIGLQGRSVIEFIVEKDGSLSNFSVKSSLSPDCDEESIRVIAQSPKWEAAKINGEKVRSTYILPVFYRNSAGVKKVINLDRLDKAASFPGGEAAFDAFIEAHYSYPKAAAENGITGEVWIDFIVDENGSIRNPLITKSLHKKCDKIALSIINKMPNWEAAEKDGKTVNQYKRIGIHFD